MTADGAAQSQSPARDPLVAQLRAYSSEAASAAGSAAAVRPAHRAPFHWPPQSVAAQFHVGAGDWKERIEFEQGGEVFSATVAVTPFGVFGRSDLYWNDARGETQEAMLKSLKRGLEPLLARQRAIAASLGLSGRYETPIRLLSPLDLMKLLYCPDRDVAAEAQKLIETHASQGQFTEGLIEILRDSEHPHRRSAQWCVLDMFEDLPAFARKPGQAEEAVDAIRQLIWTAEDDYARTVYKAGVVLGGHICTNPAADALISCIHAPHRIGRRSAMHAVFHLAEWMPERRGQIVAELTLASQQEPDPLLRSFAAHMAEDVSAGSVDHVPEPAFPEDAIPC